MGFPHGFRGRPGALHVAKAVLLAGSTVGAELCLACRAVPNGFRGGGVKSIEGTTEIYR